MEESGTEEKSVERKLMRDEERSSIKR